MSSKNQSPMKNLTIRIDAELHEQATALFDELGTDMTGAIRMFLRQAVRQQAIPFNITAKVKEHEKATYELVRIPSE